MFRFTIGKKIIGLLIVTLGIGIGGSLWLSTGLFVSEMSDHVKKSIMDQSSLLSGRVRAELKEIAEKSITLSSAALEDFKHPEDQLKFIQTQLSRDSRLLSISLFDETAPSQYRKRWTVYQLRYEKALRDKGLLQAQVESPLDLLKIGYGENQFVLSQTPTGHSSYVLGIYFVRKKDIKENEPQFSKILQIEIDSRATFIALKDPSNIQSLLIGDDGRVLASPDPKTILLGSDYSGHPLWKKLETANQDQIQSEFTDHTQSTWIGALQRTGFSKLTVLSQSSLKEVTLKLSKLQNQIKTLGIVLGCFSIALGLWISMTITKPIHELDEAAQKIRSGQFSTRIGTDDFDRTSLLRNDELSDLAQTFNSMAGGLEERERLRSTFVKFHSKEIAEQVIKGELSLGGKRQNAFILFSDLRGFTRLSEKLEPEVIVKITNRYFSMMVKIIMKHQGIVDKFVGDAVMAVWGLPENKPGDAERVVMACLEMRTALAELNEGFKSEGLPLLHMGIGVNYGTVIAGNIGSDERMEYTVLGDAVNFSSRIESATKVLGTDLLISQAVVDQLKSQFVLEKFEKLKIPGKEETQTLYKVVGYRATDGKWIKVETPYSTFDANTVLAQITGKIPKPISASPVKTTSFSREFSAREAMDLSQFTISGSIKKPTDDVA